MKGRSGRKKTKFDIDESNSNIRVKKDNGEPRNEPVKNLSLSGKANKKFVKEEKDVEDKDAKQELVNKVQQAEAEDRAAREEAARLAYENSLKQAKARAKKQEPKEEPKKEEPKKKATPVENNMRTWRYKTGNSLDKYANKVKK